MTARVAFWIYAGFTLANFALCVAALAGAKWGTALWYLGSAGFSIALMFWTSRSYNRQGPRQ